MEAFFVFFVGGVIHLDDIRYGGTGIEADSCKQNPEKGRYCNQKTGSCFDHASLLGS
jgi:hypothetical protein